MVDAALLKFTQYLSNRIFHPRDLFCDGPPNDPKVYRNVIVDELILHSNHLTSRHVWVPLSYFIGQTFCCFPDDFKISYDSEHGLFVTSERLERGTINELLSGSC